MSIGETVGQVTNILILNNLPCVLNWVYINKNVAIANDIPLFTLY